MYKQIVYKRRKRKKKLILCVPVPICDFGLDSVCNQKCVCVSQEERERETYENKYTGKFFARIN